MIFSHIINPVMIDVNSDLFAAQPVTFISMLTAKNFVSRNTAVNLFSAQYPEDRVMIPEYIQTTPDLDRSTLDIGDFEKKRKLPFIKDILHTLGSGQ